MIKFKDINYPRRKEKEIIINLPNEIWKDVCDGYKVSNYGRVLSLAKTTIRGRKYDKIYLLLKYIMVQKQFIILLVKLL